METFAVRNLSFSYPQQTAKALDEVCFSVAPREFLVVCGPSGCGKSTLLRQLKTVLTPHGTRTGEIFFEGEPLDSLSQRIQSARIGFVLQSPDNQIVTDKVWHELAFGLEGLGFDTPTIRQRVAEMASFFGIQNWFYRDVAELSGGQKQLLNLASIMAMQPSALILDEPTSQLDPIAASDFLAAVGRINRELGVTVILTEHRLEEAFPLADRVLVLENGRVLADGTVPCVGEILRQKEHGLFLAMPSAMRIWAACGGGGSCPVTVREGRTWLEGVSERNATSDGKEPEISKKPAGTAAYSSKYHADTDAVILEDIWFRYEKDLPDVVKGLSLVLRKGEFYALLGGNGTGKSTTLGIMSGLRKPYRGQVIRSGSVAVLPQNPQNLFVKKTVLEDLKEVLPKKKETQTLTDIISFCHLEKLLSRHPYDLSGGEQQRAALAKVLLLSPDILLLDEPTKGLDAEFKQEFAQILRNLQRRGVTVFMVSHDVEFCAEYADRCGLFFDGNVVSSGVPEDFFSGNSFYTTSANRMARGFFPKAVTVADVVEKLGFAAPARGMDAASESKAQAADKTDQIADSGETAAGHGDGGLPVWRKITAVLSGAVSVWGFGKAVSVTDLSALLTSSGVSSLSGEYLRIYAVLLTALLVFTLSVSTRAQACAGEIQTPQEKRKLAKRTRLASAMILFLIPLTIFFGVYYLEDRKYYFISLLILLETMLPFVLVFEGRKPKTRELVTIAVLCALGVAGRAAFFMLPNFKPVLALVIVSGIAFGGESGFLVGAMTMLVSNILFGQGPWTPWQMFSMGIIGFLAGLLYRKGFLRRKRLSMSVFGTLCAVVVYGGIMNAASAVIWTPVITKEVLLTYYISGLPVDLVHGAATFLFLWFGGRPMLEKLDRIKVKYGLVE